MQRLEVSGAVRLIYGSLGVKGLILNFAAVSTSEFRRITKCVDGWHYCVLTFSSDAVGPTFFKNSTNISAVPLLCISLLISCYMFRLNCHHQGADKYITQSYSKEILNNAYV